MTTTTACISAPLDLLLTRSSSAKLVEPGPSRAEIDQMLSAAVTAADHGRLRPWRFIVIEGNGRNRFGDLMAQAQDRAKPGQTEEDLAKVRKKALRAPMVVALVCKIAPDHKVPVIEQQLAAGAAGAQLMLAARALGFGCSWKTGSMAYDPKVIEALGFGPNDRVIGFFYFGTEAEASPARRATIEDVVEYWGDAA